MKKFILQMLLVVLVMVGGTTVAQAEGELQLPSISQLNIYYANYDYFFLNNPNSTETVLVGDYDKLNIVKASKGTVLQTFNVNSSRAFTTNDDNTYFVTTETYGYLNIFNKYGETVLSRKEYIIGKDEKFSDFNNIAFIPNTNILVITSNNSKKLIGFDVEKQEIVFYRNITQGSKMTVSSKYIALSGNTNNVIIYDTNGEYIHAIQTDMNVNTIKFTEDGEKLIIGGDSNQLSIYDVENAFEKINLNTNQFKLNKDGTFHFIDIDESGKFLVALTNKRSHYAYSVFDFNLFDFQTGQRIYTNLDSINNVTNSSISSNGKYILVNGTVYLGDNLNKRVTKITIPTKYQTIELGTKKSLSLQTTLANGTTKEITSGITWATSDFNKAYLKSGQMIAEEVGSFKLKATYLGFETTIDVNVLPDTTPPTTLTVNKVTNKIITVTGKTEAKATVEVKLGSKLLGKATADSKGNYKVKIKVQKKGSKLTVVARDQAKNAKTVTTTVK